MRLHRALPLILLLSASMASAQAPSADDIMQRVAQNLDRAEAERAHYVYLQHAHIASRKGKKILCEETTDTRITPSADGFQQELLALDGRLWHKNAYQHYTHLLKQKPSNGEGLEIDLGPDGDTDVDLVEGQRRHLLSDTDSKDGVRAGLFPLSSKALPDYVYHLAAREPMNGRDTFHLTFRPRDKDSFDWQGDAWIDTSAFQPVLVRTRLARGIPLGVKVLLGTNVPGLGFSVTYAPQPDGTWFPVTFGTEYKIHVLYFFNREITIAATNRDFQKTHVDARILDGTSPQ